jgi:amino acid adenylation domain-containing protein
MTSSGTVAVGSIAEAISARFEKQVTANRQKVAISAHGGPLSYQALNEAANRIARALLNAVPHTQTVGVLIGQGSCVIAAMLGVLKARKIFVPLDPSQPPARLLQIIDDCQARVLVTDTQNLEGARTWLPADLQLLNVGELDGSVNGDNLELPVESEALACLIYTSGSTGVPKGVMQTHRNLLHKVEALTNLLQVDGHDRIGMLATCSVAQGVSTALQALLNGASLHPFDVKERGVGELAAWLTEQKITVLVCGPSTFRHFTRTLTPRDEFPDIRAIRLGSEQVLAGDVELYQRHFNTHCVLVGTLGSTEAGPIAACVMDHGTEIDDVVPAGYPVSGTTIRILDDDERLSPVGEPGEIIVRSQSVFTGYWRDPDRTAVAFVSVPGADDAEFYRTGDLGKWRPDGSLEFVGRKNLRVKIRGVRIELEEIERALCTHPAVREAVVAVHRNRSEDQRLVAGVVSAPGARLTADDLRAHLRRTLPEQMMPSTFQFVAALPRTANGKICRTALPAPLDTPSLDQLPNRLPSDNVELRLLRIWEELLEHSPISVTANFFELGGHSLLAARLSTSIERTFGAKIPLSAFVDAVTIEQQARLIRQYGKTARWPSLVPIRATGSKPPLFFMHMREGDVLAYRDLARHLPADQPLYGLQSRGLDGMSPINTRIEDMARDYVREIRKLYPNGPYALCGWSFGGVVAFEVARQLEHQGQPVVLLALLDSVIPSRRGTPRSGAVFRREFLRAPSHVSTLLQQKDPRSSLQKKIRTVKRLVEAPLWRILVRWQRRGGWLPRALRNVEQANRVAIQDYVPDVYQGHITFFMVARHRRHDPCREWQALAAGGLTTHDVSGTHLNMVFEPHVRTLAEKLSSALEGAWAGSQL